MSKDRSARLIIAGMNLCFASFVTGGLFIESIPRQPHETDHVTLRCFAVPAKIRLLRDCHYQWEMTPRQPTKHEDEENEDDYQVTRRTSSSGRLLNPETNVDIYDSGSLVVIDELRPEHEGRYICRLLCIGRRTESAYIDLEIGKESGAEVHKQNSKIAYITSGVVFTVIVIVTVLRFSCSNRPACRLVSRRPLSGPSRCRTTTTDRSGPDTRTEPRFTLSWIENLSTHRTSRSPIWKKPRQPRRPTILVNTVWLPTYEAAIKHTRVLSTSSVSGSSSLPEEQLSGSSPPSYDEALEILLERSRHADRHQPSDETEDISRRQQ